MHIRDNREEHRYQDDPAWPHLRLVEAVFLKASQDALFLSSSEGASFIINQGRDVCLAQSRFNKRTGRGCGDLNYNFIKRQIEKRRQHE